MTTFSPCERERTEGGRAGGQEGRVGGGGVATSPEMFRGWRPVGSDWVGRGVYGLVELPGRAMYGQATHIDDYA